MMRFLLVADVRPKPEIRPISASKNFGFPTPQESIYIIYTKYLVAFRFAEILTKPFFFLTSKLNCLLLCGELCTRMRIPAAFILWIL